MFSTVCNMLHVPSVYMPVRCEDGAVDVDDHDRADATRATAMRELHTASKGVGKHDVCVVLRDCCGAAETTVGFTETDSGAYDDMSFLTPEAIATCVQIACASGTLSAVQRYATDVRGATLACKRYLGGPRTETLQCRMRDTLHEAATTGLQLAARGGHDDVVQYLLAHTSADRTANAYGAYHEAREAKHAHVLRTLQSYKAVPPGACVCEE